jgi:hypothetical protein
VTPSSTNDKIDEHVRKRGHPIFIVRPCRKLA